MIIDNNSEMDNKIKIISNGLDFVAIKNSGYSLNVPNIG